MAFISLLVQPIFDPFPSNISDVYLMENEPVGTKIAKIIARDKDQGENGYALLFHS